MGDGIIGKQRLLFSCGQVLSKQHGDLAGGEQPGAQGKAGHTGEAGRAGACEWRFEILLIGSPVPPFANHHQPGEINHHPDPGRRHEQRVDQGERQQDLEVGPAQQVAAPGNEQRQGHDDQVKGELKEPLAAALARQPGCQDRQGDGGQRQSVGHVAGAQVRPGANAQPDGGKQRDGEREEWGIEVHARIIGGF